MSFGTFVKSARDVIKTGLQFTPLFLGVSLFTIGITTCNIPFMILFAGMFLLLPLAVLLLTWIFKFTPIPLFKASESLFPIVQDSTDSFNISFGFSMLIFFFAYLLTNAGYLIKNNEDPVIRGRASISIGIVGFSALAYIISRILSLDKAPETGTGIAVLLVAASLLAWGWFDGMKRCDEEKCQNSWGDVYGVENNKLVATQERNICISG
jgi:uncharacterized membrane protein